MTNQTSTIQIKDKKLNLGFLGVGWIGKSRMEAMLATELAQAAIVGDISAQNLANITNVMPQVSTCNHLDQLLEEDLDGIVIATPSALHADQSILALQHQVPVFCQKPLGRTAQENQAVVNQARESNRLLGVDFSYRYTCFDQIYQLIQSRELGDIYSVECVFHNAYGPDKPWFYNPKLSGGGCLIDLGVHLIDLALWSLDWPEITKVCSNLHVGGKKINQPENQVEDNALALLTTDQGTAIKIACSWNLPAGKEADIQLNVYGTKGGAAFRNTNGSFYDFEALKFEGTQTKKLFSGPDEWGGRAGIDWLQKLVKSNTYDASIEDVVKVAKVIDLIYGR
ncbi:MAG: Gfo/Idh/MocA family protein [Candidatus Cyclobacteriaceae bacterium M3_2C_046]